MLDIRVVTENFAVAPQIAGEDFALIAGAGYGAVLNNRPDEEIPGGLVHDKARAAAAKAGLDYAYIPVRVRPPDLLSVRGAVAYIHAREGAVLAWCRSGTRSIQLWAMVQVWLGRLSVDEAVIIADRAGYDLSGISDSLQGLARRN